LKVIIAQERLVKLTEKIKQRAKKQPHQRRKAAQAGNDDLESVGFTMEDVERLEAELRAEQSEKVEAEANLRQKISDQEEEMNDLSRKLRQMQKRKDREKAYLKVAKK